MKRRLEAEGKAHCLNEGAEKLKWEDRNPEGEKRHAILIGDNPHRFFERNRMFSPHDVDISVTGCGL
jgi:hypothetical protein